MSTTDWKLQVNVRSGYLESQQEKPVQQQNRFDDDEELLLPTSLNGRTDIKLKDDSEENKNDNDEKLYPIGINPK